MLRLNAALYQDSAFRLQASFEVAAGTVAAVLGPSGAGKTTLLNLIAGFAPMAGGTIEAGGTDISIAPPEARPVSMVFQDNNVFPHLSLEQNVALGVAPSLRLTEAQRHEVAEALARVGLAGLAGRKPGAVSGGERQRVALARVLVRRKPVLLLDEPFAALDPGLRRDMLGLVAEITTERAMATLIVSHQPLEVAERAQQAIFVAEGVARAPVPMSDFLAAKGDPAIASYLGLKPSQLSWRRQ